MEIKKIVIDGNVLFEGIHLGASFILDWNYLQNEAKLIFDVDFAVFPENPFYEKPNKNHYTFYKKSQLEFCEVEEIIGYEDKATIPPDVDIDGSLSWGEIEVLSLYGPNVYKIETEFFDFRITCNNLILRME